MNNTKKPLCVLLAVIMALSLATSALAAGTFADVPEDSPYAEYIEDIYARGITNGTTTTGPMKFNPEGTLTRIQFVTFIGRLAGIDRTKYTENPFTDYAPADYKWAAGYVEWAYALGITEGVSTTGPMRFNPEGKLSRAEMATFMYRFADKYGIELGHSATQASDIGEIASWALEAVKVFGGVSIDLDKNGRFNATDRATRAQMAKVISLFPVPDGGFVIPTVDPPTPQTRDYVMVNGMEIKLSDINPSKYKSYRIADIKCSCYDFAGKYAYNEPIPENVPVTIVCADKEVQINSDQLRASVFVFSRDGESVADTYNGVTYTFQFAFPGTDGMLGTIIRHVISINF